MKEEFSKLQSFLNEAKKHPMAKLGEKLNFHEVILPLVVILCLTNSSPVQAMFADPLALNNAINGKSDQNISSPMPSTEKVKNESSPGVKFMDLLNELDPMTETINSFAQATLHDKDFKGGHIPIFQTKYLHFVIATGENYTWGGGLAGYLGPDGSPSPGKIEGPYNNSNKIKAEYSKAFANLAMVDTHEMAMHAFYQTWSNYFEIAMQGSRDGYTNYEDWQSALTHTSQGVWEYVASRKVGVETNYPSWKVYFIFDRLLRGGASPTEAVKMIANAAVHGLAEGQILQVYNKGLQPGDQKLEILMLVYNDNPDQWIDSKSVDQFNLTASQLAKLKGIPPHYELPRPAMSYPIFEITDSGGPAVIQLDKYSPSSNLYLADFRQLIKSTLQTDIDNIISGKTEGSALAYLLKADSNFINDLNRAWRDSGRPAKLSKSEFITLLRKTSPAIEKAIDQLTQGPILDLPKPTGHEKMVYLVPKSEWNFFQVFCVAETKDPWIVQWGTPFSDGPKKTDDGRYEGLFIIKAIRVSNGGFDLRGCPPGSRIVAMGEGGIINLVTWDY